MGGQVASQQTPEPAEKPAVQVWNKGAPTLSSRPATLGLARIPQHRPVGGAHLPEVIPPRPRPRKQPGRRATRPALTIPERARPEVPREVP